MILFPFCGVWVHILFFFFLELTLIDLKWCEQYTQFSIFFLFLARVLDGVY